MMPPSLTVLPEWMRRLLADSARWAIRLLHAAVRLISTTVILLSEITAVLNVIQGWLLATRKALDTATMWLEHWAQLARRYDDEEPF